MGVPLSRKSRDAIHDAQDGSVSFVMNYGQGLRTGCEFE